MFVRVLVFLALVCTANAAAPLPIVPLRRVALGDTEATAMGIPVDPNNTATVYVIETLPIFAGADFREALAPYIGKPITTELVKAVIATIGKVARAHDRLIANVQVPNQNANDGTIRLAVAIEKYRDIEFRGNRWFSNQLLEEKLGIKPGDEIRLSVLESAINWANTNPFRQLKVFVNPITNQPGQADLIVGVQDALPWRFSTSADNYGNSVLGQWQYTASIQAGNIWGLDHQATYQFATSDNLNVYQAHAIDYRVPLPWRHYVEFSASYSRVHPTFGVNNVFSQTGQNESADLKYTIPIKSDNNPIEVHAGLDFKRGNNNIEYGGIQVFTSNSDTFQLNLGGSLVHRDKHGGWALGASVNLSPGNIDAKNNQATYQATRFGSSPRYAYATVTAQRLQELGRGWELSSRVIGQVASTNLLGSEQLTIGGPTTVRGFQTNVYAGDEGFIFSNDLMTPVITTGLQKIRQNLPPLQSRFVLFYDAAEVFYKHQFGFDPKLTPLASAGVGLRMNLASNLSVNFDYGWQITRLPYINNQHAYGHFKVVLAF